jgi:hypothetical protein
LTLLSPRDLVAGSRLLAALPSFLRRPVSLEQARQTMTARFERRPSDFLRLADVGIFRNPKSPYRTLLRMAGCERADLAHMVRQDGLEGAFSRLYHAGVYLTVAELKGREPVRRGSSQFTFQVAQLRNPLASFHLVGQSGGSRGRRVDVPIDLGFVRDHAVNWRLALDALGCKGRPSAQWTVPGGQSLFNLLESVAYGSPLIRWFSQVDLSSPGLHPRYRWSARAVRWAGRAVGVPVPRPEYVPLESAQPVTRWLAGVLAAGARPYMGTTASGAVRLCQAALELGIDLRGAHFSVGGEPLTPARLAVIHGVGADALTSYGSSEAGRIGYGCAARDAPDDQHHYHDMVALIQPGPGGEHAPLPARALLTTSLRATAPLILLNVSLGDEADLVTRSCGCPLERVGWSTHIRDVRSFEKLSAGGMTFLDYDVVRVLETTLPARFGGGPIDYQLIEEETEDGRPLLRLLVHPKVGPLDEAMVADAFLAAIGGGSGVERVMELQWRQGDVVRVERRAPLVSAAGKVLHVSRVAGKPC